MDSLIASALKARTVADVERLEAEIVRRVGGQWARNLGDNETNWSVVGSPVDPRTVVFERVTNMWDAIIEAEAKRRRDFSCATPADAGRKFLGVPVGGPSELDAGSRERLARLSTLTFLDSDDPVRRPSIAARDHGIGLTPAEMPETILSLHRSNKLNKPYLHGVFGKGGSVACMFSRATIIVTRKQPDLLRGGEDSVALAIVREADAPDVRLPFFRYLTNADGLPYSVPAAKAEFEPGTLVVHIDYQAEKMGSTNWQYEDSIYAFAETLLFRPTLPYQLEDGRSDPYNRRPEARRKPTMLMGLGQRLDATDEDKGLVDASRGQARLTIPDVGDVGVRWWLFDDEDKRRRRAARGHVALFTTGGQVHHAWDTQRFKTLVEGRQRVARRVIVEVDTDSVDQKKRVRIFSSFRDAVLKSPEAAALELAVAEWLASDPDLEDAEARFTREALRSSDQEISAALRDRLNRAIRARSAGVGGRQPGPGPRPKPPAPRPAEELYAEPTEFVGPESLKAVPGERKALYVKCNAIDGFVPARGEVEVAAPLGLTYGIGDLRRGRLQLSLAVPDSAPLGNHKITVSLTWMRAAGGTATLSWPITLELVSEIPAPVPPRGRHGRKPTTRSEFAFLWSDPEHEDGWSDQVVGELLQIRGAELAEAQPQTYGDLKGVEETVPTVVLNERFRDLANYLRGTVAKASDQQLHGRRDRYAVAVGAAVANLYLIEEKLRKAHAAWEQEANGREEPERPMTEAQLKRALAEHARGVLTLLPEFDELLGDVDRDETLVGV
jgi:hypothetical protein